MAGMEIFGWLTAISTLALIAAKIIKIEKIGPEWILFGLFCVVFVGAFFNSPTDTPAYEIIGKTRWLLLLYLVAWAMRYSGIQKAEKVFGFLLVLAGVIAIYAIIQHFTGWDFLRNSNRAVQFYGYRGDGSPFWRSAGLFSAPLTYGYSFAMFLCFPLALLVLDVKKNWRWRLGLLFLVLVMGTSLVSTFQRGVWLGACFGVGGVLLLSRRKLALCFFALALLGVAGGLIAVPRFQHRVETIFDPDYQSNRERFDLWKANFAIFKDYPIFGVGYGENEKIVGEYFSKLGIKDGFVSHAHNNYVQMLSGTGALGFLLYFALIGYFLILSLNLWRRNSDDTWAKAMVLGAFGAQISLHVGGLTECNFKDTEINHQVMFLFAFLLFLKAKTPFTKLTLPKASEPSQRVANTTVAKDITTREPCPNMFKNVWLATESLDLAMEGKVLVLS